jgi:glutamate/tyrosine decarboxylase-like PLP-dependent enzyme
MTDRYVHPLNLAAAAAKTHLAGLPSRRPFPPPAALAALAAFDAAWPDVGCDPAAVIAELDRIGTPAATAMNGGRYFGFVMGGTLPAALAANWLAAAWDQNAVNAVASPIGAKLEQVASRWLLEALDLPRHAAVGYVTGAASANFTALLVARHALMKRCGWNLRRQGMRGAPALRVLVGAEAHPVVTKALSLAGFGVEEWEVLPADEQGRIDARRLPALDERTLIVAQAGNVNSGSFDPFAEICGRARAAGAWVHVDGAFGLWARASQSKKPLTHGIELADSWAVDAHKWLNVPYDSAIYICRDAASAAECFDIEAPYIGRDAARAPNALTLDLSRRARAIEIWAALKALGRRGVAEMVERHCRQAVRFAAHLHDAGFDILNEVVLNQVVATVGDGERVPEIVARVQEDGICWIGPTVWRDRRALRLSVSSEATTDDDIDVSAAAIARVKHTVYGAST